MSTDETHLPGATIAAKQILDWITPEVSSNGVLHLESVAVALGALAGHACLVAALECMAEGRPGYQGGSFTSLRGANGFGYTVTTMANKSLANDSYSVWSMLTSKLTALGLAHPDAAELLNHDEATKGTDASGIPRYSSANTAGRTPIAYLELWDAGLAVITPHAPDPEQWPLVYVIAMRQVLETAAPGHDIARLFMESAIAMSRRELHPDRPGPDSEVLHAGSQTAAASVLDAVMKATTTPHGVHLESLITALGALAGRASHLAAVDGIRTGNSAYSGRSINVIGSHDGRDAYIGEAINLNLAGATYSVWSLAAAKAIQFTQQLPDLDELFLHGAKTLGGPEFGRPRYAPGTEAGRTPVEYLELWDDLTPTLEKLAPHPQQWPAVFGIALQNAFALTKGEFDTTALLRVAMDSALAMSKLRP